MFSFLSKFNKAWVAAAAAFAVLTLTTFFGINVSPTTQAGIVSAVTAVLTWLVPNYD